MVEGCIFAWVRTAVYVASFPGSSGGESPHARAKPGSKARTATRTVSKCTLLVGTLRSTVT